MDIDPLLMDEARAFMGLQPLSRRERMTARHMSLLADLSFNSPEPATAKLSNTAEPTVGVSLADIGECLRAAREDEGISLGELEAQTGMSRARLSRLETRVTPNPTIDTLARIAAALGLRIVVALRSLEDEQ